MILGPRASLAGFIGWSQHTTTYFRIALIVLIPTRLIMHNGYLGEIALTSQMASAMDAAFHNTYASCFLLQYYALMHFYRLRSIPTTAQLTAFMSQMITTQSFAATKTLCCRWRG